MGPSTNYFFYPSYLRSLRERRVMNYGQVVLGVREVLENSPRSVNAADSSWHVEQTHDRLRRYVGQRRKVFGALRSRNKYAKLAS